MAIATGTPAAVTQNATLSDVEGSRRIVEDHDRNAVRCVQNDPAPGRKFVERHRQRGFELRAQPRLLGHRPAHKLGDPGKYDACQGGERAGFVHVREWRGKGNGILHVGPLRHTGVTTVNIVNAVNVDE